ncbi:unnamed protein product [Brassica oleracea var. botrytis]
MRIWFVLKLTDNNLYKICIEHGKIRYAALLVFLSSHFSKTVIIFFSLVVFFFSRSDGVSEG